ncbi:DUF885 domain-containing protein [Edaphobacter aggregans]|uniref:DUF885 domain-containing protein n=1 Tax=Edaphobacter aggregans TaxID=570835 RepID=UPI00055317D1|nr:DUF885 domain-containing protein [Edaphobacter aggregans]
MNQLLRLLGVAVVSMLATGALAQGQTADRAWIAKSNAYTQQLLDVQFEHAPESGSRQGLVKFDKLISNPTLEDQQARRKQQEVVLTKLKAAEATEKDKNVVQDLEILDKAFDLQFREQDYELAHKVPFMNASSAVFGGLRGLLDDQVAAERRPDAVVRLRKYAGVEPGYKPFTEILKQRTLEQIAKPGLVYPSKAEVETELGRNKNYVDGIAALFTKYKLTGWDEPYAKLKVELADYDAWVRTTILPKARTDFREPAEEYALDLEGYGIDIPPAQMAAMAHKAFAEYQAEMAPLAAQIAKQHGWASTDYRDVIKELKKTQITGDAILPFYEKRLVEIEGIIRAQNLVTLPDRPAIIRLATAAETAQQPAPHMTPPPFLHNTGQRGEFVLPLNIPSATGGAEDKYDDFTFDAVAWTLTAHEARPGHELQFDSMVEHGVSLARALYAFNSTNVEGWGLYSEYVMKPYMPLEGQLMSLDLRLLRAARAFLDPELQSGKVTPEGAYKVLENDVVLSHAFATEEVERFTFRAPGQANSYFYGYTKLLGLRKDTEAALGKKFDQEKFHDFILAQGLLPPDLMRKAVMEEFIPSQK